VAVAVDIQPCYRQARPASPRQLAGCIGKASRSAPDTASSRPFHDHGVNMTDDPRCCGSGMCIIDGQGRCWCGQQWDGQKMCRPPLVSPAPDAAASLRTADGSEGHWQRAEAGSSPPKTGG